MNLRAAPLLVFSLLPLVMGFSSKPKFTISFHAQADEMDPKKTCFPMQIEGQPVLFKIVPEIAQTNVAAFHPFDSETGDGKGVALQLDVRGKGALEMVTRTRQGQYLLAMVNGKPTDYLVIDQVVDNGLVTVWRGISEEMVKQLDKKFPRIKPGGPPSMSQNMEMIPATKKEKKESLQQSKDAERAAEKNRKAGKPEKPEIPNLEAPRAPVTTKIPVEGAAPPKATPVEEPPLPKR